MESKDIRKAGLKVTLPRVKILDVLEKSEGEHLTAENIYLKLLDVGEDIGLATIYRVLTQFESAKLVIKHNFESGQSVYELDRGEHHDHMICVICGKITEFYNELIEEQQRKIVSDQGFKFVDHSLTLYVECAEHHS